MKVNLEMTDDEARDVHHALGVVIQLLDEIETPPDAPLPNAARPGLIQVARRLDHERRHHGAVPNPNGPS